MGGKNTSEIKTIIKKELNNEVINKTKTISDVVNAAINNVSQSIKQDIETKVQEAESNVQITTLIGNELNMKGVKISDSNVNISQDARAKIENIAIINIITNNLELQKMGNNISDNIKTNIESNQNVKQDLESLSKIGQFSKKSGGQEGMVDTLTIKVNDIINKTNGSSKSTS